MVDNNYFTCSICLEFTSDSPTSDYFVSTSGGHIFHYLCIKQYLENGEESCPLCRESISLSKLTRLYGIKLKKSNQIIKLSSDGGDGTLPSLKIVLLGNSTVGKSSLIGRMTNNSFESTINPTVGCDVCFRNLVVGRKVFRLNLWDTAGQENFKSVVSTTIRNSQAIIFVYDITNPQSLVDIEAWLEFSYKYCSEDVVRVLVGNKIDLDEEQGADGDTFGKEELDVTTTTSSSTNQMNQNDGGGRRRKVSRLVGEAVAEKLKLPYFETSAKTGINLEALFKSVVGFVLENPIFKETNLVEIELDEGDKSNKFCGRC